MAIALYIIGFSLKIQTYQYLLNTEINQVLDLMDHLDNKSMTNQSILLKFNTSSQLFIDKTLNNLDDCSLNNWSFNCSTEKIKQIQEQRLDNLLQLHMFKGSGYSANIWSPDLSYYIVTNDIFTLSRIMLSFSLFAFCVRLMYIFSFSVVLGPKLIMINRMVSLKYFV